MVFAFLCHSIASTPCRVLYSVVYGEDMQSAAKQVMTRKFISCDKELITGNDCRVFQQMA